LSPCGFADLARRAGRRRTGGELCRAGCRRGAGPGQAPGAVDGSLCRVARIHGTGPDGTDPGLPHARFPLPVRDACLWRHDAAHLVFQPGGGAAGAAPCRSRRTIRATIGEGAGAAAILQPGAAIGTHPAGQAGEVALGMPALAFAAEPIPEIRSRGPRDRRARGPRGESPKNGGAWPPHGRPSRARVPRRAARALPVPGPASGRARHRRRSPRPTGHGARWPRPGPAAARRGCLPGGPAWSGPDQGRRAIPRPRNAIAPGPLPRTLTARGPGARVRPFHRTGPRRCPCPNAPARCRA